MILQALNQLYERLADDEEYRLPQVGYSTQNVTFRIVLNPDGSLQNIEDVRESITETLKSGKTKTRQIPRQMRVPDLGGRTSGIKPYFLSDKLSYLTGYDLDPSKRPLADKQFAAARKLHLDVDGLADCAQYNAIRAYFRTFDLAARQSLLEDSAPFTATGFGVFRVLPFRENVHEAAAIRDYWAARGDTAPETDEVKGQCLATGKFLPLARLHEPKFGGFGTDKPLLVSFNDPAYRSYGKDQSYNAPVSTQATFQYCNALNSLLSGAQSHRHRVSIGEATTVFWTECKTATESLFAQFLGGNVVSAEIEAPPHPFAQDAVLHQRLTAFLDLLRRGSATSFRELADDPATKFFILGLSKVSKSRLAVRFWHVGTIEEMVSRLRSHFAALSIHKSFDDDPEFPAAIRLLDQTARERKAIRPILGVQLMQSILHGTPYPLSLVQGVLTRLRANEPVNYLKASILKAFLIRNHHKQMNEAIDPTRKESAYHLGRLFAVYEVAQRHAHDWKLDRTIRETMYSAASATPLAVFGRLERLHHHHTAKKSHPRGSSDSYADIVASISQNFRGPGSVYPATLDIVQQSLFAVGYYHQLQFFRELGKAKEMQIAPTT